MHVVVMVVMVMVVSGGRGGGLGRFLRVGGSGTEPGKAGDDEADGE